MPKRTEHARPTNEAPENRAESEQDEPLKGQVNPDRGSSGVPQGGQINGRQGEQQGIKK